MQRRLDYAKATMPVLLQEAARLTSPALAIRLARKFGGQPLYFPRKIAAKHPIAQCLGLTAAERLCRELGGQTVEVPSATPFLRWLDARALKMLGLPHSEIGERLGVSDRHLRHLLEGFDPAEYEIDATVLAVGRLYRIHRTRLGPELARRRDDRQLDMGWPVDAKGMRYSCA